MTIRPSWCNNYTIYSKIKQTLLRIFNVHSLSTPKMPTSGELPPVHYCGSKANCTCTVYSLANHFMQIDKQWKYDLHPATTILYTAKSNKHCCGCWMYIHCLPRKCRYPVNLQTPFMMKSESLGLPVHYYVSNSHCARTVYSLANHFTQVDNQWQYDLHVACNNFIAHKKNETKIATVECTSTIYP